eukprot:1146981-Alexandrium_andersonii.AAC.1
MPCYDDLLGARYSVNQVLAACGNVTDLAFVEMQWRYATLMTEKYHPHGLHRWPPPWEGGDAPRGSTDAVSYTHLRAHETSAHL